MLDQYSSCVLFFTFGYLLLSCDPRKEIVEIDLPASSERLVVEATMSKLQGPEDLIKESLSSVSNNNSVIKDTLYVSLHRTVSYTSTDPLSAPVTGADVVVTDENNLRFNLTESSTQRGLYMYTGFTSSNTIKNDIEYKIEVKKDGLVLTTSASIVVPTDFPTFKGPSIGTQRDVDQVFSIGEILSDGLAGVPDFTNEKFNIYIVPIEDDPSKTSYYSLTIQMYATDSITEIRRNRRVVLINNQITARESIDGTLKVQVPFAPPTAEESPRIQPIDGDLLAVDAFVYFRLERIDKSVYEYLKNLDKLRRNDSKATLFNPEGNLSGEAFGVFNVNTATERMIIYERR